MPKIYEGDPDETCPQMGGKLCRKVCPSCKMYKQFFRDTNDGVRQPFMECTMIMNTSVTIEGNSIAAQLEKRLLGNQAAIESLRNEMVRGLEAHGINTVEAIGAALQIAQRGLPPMRLISDSGIQKTMCQIAQIADATADSA